MYLYKNFDEEDFQYGYHSVRCSDDPLDFFYWHPLSVFDWYSLNEKLVRLAQLSQSKLAANETSLKDYTTKDIGFAGCDPVIADALKQNKSILCNVGDGGDGGECTEQNVVSYREGKPYPYMTRECNVYKHAEPIKKTKTELRVKDPVSVMQWLVDNGYSIVPGNVFVNGHGNLFFTELFALCGKVPPANWKWSELLEEVAVKCEHEDSEPCDPFKTDDPNPLAI